MPQTMLLEDVVTSAMDAVLQNVWTSMPARVETYDPVLQRANVQLVVKNASVAEGGERRSEKIAVINAVPVVYASGGGFRQIFPLVRGDTVLLVFTSRSLDRWLSKGGVVDPVFDHHHDLSDAVALAGLRDFAHPLTNVPTDHASIGYESGATIELRSNEIRVGGDVGTEPTLMASTFLSKLKDLLDAIATAVGTSGSDVGATAAAGDITTAINTFTDAASTYTTSVAKVV